MQLCVCDRSGMMIGTRDFFGGVGRRWSFEILPSMNEIKIGCMYAELACASATSIVCGVLQRGRVERR